MRYALLALAMLAAPAVAQVTANLPVVCNASGSICTQATPVVNPDGTTISGGGGSSTRTTPAGTSDTVAVPVQGVTGGVPQRITGIGQTASATAQTVVPATDSASFPIAGNVAAGATDTGNPIKVGGVYRATPPTYTDGQRTELVTGSGGPLFVTIAGAQGYANSVANTSSDTLAPTTGNNRSLTSISLGYVFDGTNFLRARGDLNGTYVVNKGAANLVTAQVSVGTTATLVAAARTGRSRLVITQGAAGPCYYSSSATVSATTGARLTAAGASKAYNYAGALYGICPGGAVTTDADEEF